MCDNADGDLGCITKIIEWGTYEIYSWKIQTNVYVVPHEFHMDENSLTCQIM